MIAQFKMHAKYVVENGSVYKINNARCKGLIMSIRKGVLFGFIGCGIQEVWISPVIASHGCTLSSLVPAIL